MGFTVASGSTPRGGEYFSGILIGYVGADSQPFTAS
jgi:hypothetical protein